MSRGCSCDFWLNNTSAKQWLTGEGSGQSILQFLAPSQVAIVTCWGLPLVSSHWTSEKQWSCKGQQHIAQSRWRRAMSRIQGARKAYLDYKGSSPHGFYKNKAFLQIPFRGEDQCWELDVIESEQGSPGKSLLLRWVEGKRMWSENKFLGE